jgi:hypothetical protein
MNDATVFSDEDQRKDAALSLAALGFQVLPVKAGEKRPDPLLAPDGFQNATRDTEAIGTWYDLKPKANIGVAVGARYGLLVVDVDTKNGARGLETLAALEVDVLTLTADTPSGGLHLYFKHPGVALKATLDGIDIKGAGGCGYVLAPPSVLSEAFAQSNHCSAGAYRWRDAEIPVAELPPRLLEQLSGNNGPSSPRAAVGPVASIKVPQGQRHTRLVELGAVLRGKALQPDEVEVLLWHHALRDFDPPFSRDDPENVREVEGVARWFGAKEANGDSAVPLALLSTAQLIQRAQAAPARQILDPILPEAGALMIYGATGVGKSHVGLCLAGAIALGRPFLDWTVTEPLPVLFIDGEMSLGELAARVAAYFGDDPLERLQWIAARATAGDLPNMADPAAQERYFAAILSSGARVVVLDNMSCLRSTCAELSENSIEGWQPVGAFIRRLNRMGIAVILVHHANKAGGQRGSTGHVGVMDTVLCLRALGEGQADPRAENDLELVFEKHRLFGGEAAQAIRAKAIGDPDGRVVWQRVGVDALVDDVVRLRKQGMSIRAMAGALERTKKAIEKALGRAKARGLLPLTGGAE